MKNEAEKIAFARHLKGFSAVLADRISCNGAWTVKGFIDIFRNVYTISSDTKIVSKILELHLFPHFISFADTIGYEIELAKHQNYYPDLTFISRTNPAIKEALINSALPSWHIFSALSVSTNPPHSLCYASGLSP